MTQAVADLAAGDEAEDHTQLIADADRLVIRLPPDLLIGQQIQTLLDSWKRLIQHPPL